MNVPFNDLGAHHQTLQPALGEAIQRVLAKSSFVRGPDVDAFEEEFAKLMGSNHCVSCANGTDALYASMRGLGIEPGDEVITTAHSWISTSETITQAGGRVVFCDTHPDTFNIDPKHLETLITPRTRGIIPVHLYGQPAEMDEILQIAQKHNLWVIEDCAQAHLATYRGKTVGNMGNAGTFSFYPGKNLGAIGDAGGIVTQNSQLSDWLTTFCRHGGKGNHLMEGINSRMDGIHGAVLRLKLPRLQGWTAARRKVASRYNEGLDGVGDIFTPVLAPEREHVYHLYVVRTDRRDELREYLKQQGVQTVLNYSRALPFYPAYDYLGHTPADFPCAAANQDRILSLPIFPEISDEQIDFVISSIRAFFAGRS